MRQVVEAQWGAAGAPEPRAPCRVSDVVPRPRIEAAAWPGLASPGLRHSRGSRSLVFLRISALGLDMCALVAGHFEGF